MNLFSLIKSSVDKFLPQKKSQDICSSTFSDYSISIRIEALLPICFHFSNLNKREKYELVNKIMEDVIKTAKREGVTLDIEDTLNLSECNNTRNIEIKGWVINKNNQIRECEYEL
jgi:hypothetical protein